MWLAEQAAQAGREGERAVDIGVVTISGGKGALCLEGETRQSELVAPTGICWRPKVGQQMVVGRCDGEYFTLGAPGESCPVPLEEGELYLHSGESSIHIRRDGTMELKGIVNVQGELQLNGINILNYMMF